MEQENKTPEKDMNSPIATEQEIQVQSGGPREEVDSTVGEDDETETARAGVSNNSNNHVKHEPEKSVGEGEKSDEKDKEEDLLEGVDLNESGKDELLSLLKKFSHIGDMRVLDKGLRELGSHFEKIRSKEEATALEAFVAAGNEETDFEYKGDDTDRQFHDLYELLKERKQHYFANLEREKEANLSLKNRLLDQLRELVDGEESTTSMSAVKELQSEWKKIGPVPRQYARGLWANYNALIDRFYDHRSIYFELKELDRKKNLEGKLELCERAEALDELENIKDAIFQLNELHEEFKHLGPVPKEDQEGLWQRFKAASDKIYAKRKDFIEDLKKEQVDNLKQKQLLGDLVADFVNFDSDKISDWNKKTKEILELQKKWESVGSIPREKAREINRHFWSNFKKFFSNKNAFFRRLEDMREGNLKKKQELVARAEEVKESSEWDKTAGLLKNLQNEWREIGPVPEKVRNQIYDQFKKACDHFFERKRSRNSSQNHEFAENLKRKEEICRELEDYIQSDTIELDKVYDYLEQYAEIGFVPRQAIKAIHDRFDQITEQLLDLEELSEDQRSELKIQIQVSKLKNSPHGDQKIHRKESALRRKISTLETDITTWRTNLEFFAESKKANALKGDFNEKIESAEKELEDLKKQLEVLHHS